MRLSHSVYAFLFSVILVVTACKAPPSETTHEAVIFDPLIHSFPHDISDVARDPDVTYGKLDNGMRYILRTNARPEGEAVMRFWVKAGSKHETEDTIGLAHFLEHMAFNGSENVPEGEMVKSLERLGLSFGADTNASTTYTRTEYRLNLPNLDDETLDYSFFIMRETADKLLIDQDAVDRERGVVMAEEARGNTPLRTARRAYIDWAYPNRRSTRFNVIGSPESLEAITAEQLRTFYDSYYRPERSVLVLAGDFDVADMEARIKNTFGDWINNTPVPAEPDDGTNERTPIDRLRSYADDELTTVVYMSHTKPSTYAGDTLSARRRGFMRGYANAIVNQRISKKLLGENTTVRGANISYASTKLGDRASVNVSSKEDKWEPAIDLADFEIRQALKHGFQQGEYDELIAQTRRSLTDAANYAAKRRSASLASGMMAAFARGSVLTTPNQELTRFEDTVKDVTLADLESAFAEMWTGFDPTIWVQGPRVMDVTPDMISAVYDAAKARDIPAPKQRTEKTFAYQDFGPIGTIAARSRIDDFDINQVKFENNVYLNMKKTDFEDNWINISVTVGEGWNVFPEDKPGLTSLAGSIALGGYEAHAANELSQIFAGKSISLNLNVARERLVMSGSTNPDDVAEQFKVWAALLTAPGYRPVWQQKFQEGIEASFHTIDSTPGGVAQRDLGRLWTNGDARYGLVEKQAYLSYSLEDVRTVLQPIFDHGAIEIGVVGDFKEEDIIKAVAKTFGALPKRKDSFNLHKEAFAATFPTANRVKLTHTGADNQGAIYMAWPTQDPWTLERSRHYVMIERILQNRLIDVIREEKGLSYSPSSGVNFRRLSSPYGYLSASISADPKFFTDFEAATKSIVADLRRGGITADELNRARKPIMEGFERSAKENGAWLGNVTRSQTDPSGLEFRRSRVTMFGDMTPTALDAYAQELFAPQTLHVVEILPEGLAGN